uniref:Uncharacterized protein n=1 Tax=uncultured bacterium contig00030 TaxID=1181519 RepID=A0A806KM49_9BACT|nr:hypothetical protein [uncultured bacterium contig00030]
MLQKEIFDDRFVPCAGKDFGCAKLLSLSPLPRNDSGKDSRR